MSVGGLLKFVQKADTSLHRWRNPQTRSVLVDSRTAMNYSIIAPIHRAMQADPRIAFFFTSSENPDSNAEVYREAGESAQTISPARAALMKFDAYLTADQLWVKLPRGTRRVQMFHGVAGKYGHVYDAPSHSMREWHRIFFINRRRLQNHIASGAIDPDSTAARLVGMPKIDCMVDGSLKRDAVLRSLGIDTGKTVILYAPTWSPYSSVNAMGVELVERLGEAGFAVIAKLHDRSRDRQYSFSGGVDWGERLDPALRRFGGHLATGSDACPYLVAADVLITDHSSVGFEYLLLDRPVVRIDMPELIQKTNIHSDYVRMLTEVSTSVTTAGQAVAAVEGGLANPASKSSARRAVADELFYEPGTATSRAVREMYEVLELDALAD
jgi:CDP-Glycerol:Poly(glycerophosphate) glycerophosphotransferase